MLVGYKPPDDGISGGSKVWVEARKALVRDLWRSNFLGPSETGRKHLNPCPKFGVHFLATPLTATIERFEKDPFHLMQEVAQTGVVPSDTVVVVVPTQLGIQLRE